MLTEKKKLGYQWPGSYLFFFRLHIMLTNVHIELCE